MLWLWVLGGITAICGALTIAELSAALPKTGGDYVYLYEAYGPLPAFLSGWVSFLIGFAVPSAASAFAFAKYMIAPLDCRERERYYSSRPWRLRPCWIFAAIHVSGRSQTARVQGSITLSETLRAGRVRTAPVCPSVGGILPIWPTSRPLDANSRVV